MPAGAQAECLRCSAACMLASENEEYPRQTSRCWLVAAQLGSVLFARTRRKAVRQGKGGQGVKWGLIPFHRVGCNSEQRLAVREHALLQLLQLPRQRAFASACWLQRRRARPSRCPTLPRRCRVPLRETFVGQSAL